MSDAIDPGGPIPTVAWAVPAHRGIPNEGQGCLTRSHKATKLGSDGNSLDAQKRSAQVLSFFGHTSPLRSSRFNSQFLGMAAVCLGSTRASEDMMGREGTAVSCHRGP